MLDTNVLYNNNNEYMMKKINWLLVVSICLVGHSVYAQEISFYAQCVAKNTFEHTHANSCVTDALAYEKQSILEVFLGLQKQQDKDSKTLYRHVTQNHKIWKKHVDEECEFQGQFFNHNPEYCYLRHYEQHAKEILKIYQPMVKSYD